MTEKAKILIVDDDKSIRETLALILEEEGFEYDLAETGKQAIEKANANVYNVVLLDFRLPDVEGTKLLTKFRDTVPRMRKIMITGFPTMDNAIEALNFGADAFVRKPFEVDDVIKKVKEQLKSQDEERKYSQLKVAEYIESQYRQTK